jgi:PKD repeat protein
MKKTIAFIFGLLSVAASAQELKHCGFGEELQRVLDSDPAAKARYEKASKELAEADQKAFQEGYQNYPNGYFQPNNVNRTNGTNSVQAVVYTIPVVFHILHQEGPEKISPAQVHEQIAILNRDYNKQNADTAAVVTPFLNNIGKVEFNFVLATIDPNGNCTNGIIYHNTAQTDWTSGDPGPYTGTTTGKWNPTKYLNVYTVNSISSGAAGYTYLPGTWGLGNAKDCIIILHDYVGASGTSQVSHSRALTHEIGHWFNLPHVWGGTNQPGVACGDEGVSDTPVTMGWDHCPDEASSQVCNAGVTENYQNYMDYSYCSVMFTNGQVTRMRTAITSGSVGRNNLWSATNLNNTGVTNPQTCIPDAGFMVVYNKRYICAGNSTQFQDSTWNATVTGWNWSFPGGTPSTSTDSMPVIVYNTPGVYSVTYTASTSAGSDVVTGNNTIYVGANTATNQAPYSESFETITVPNSDWTIENPSGAVQWQQTTTAAATGSNSMMINNFTNPAASVEIFYTPSYNLAAINTASPPVSFTFKLAYQRKTTSASEKLQVFSSTNCGQTWVQRYTKSGSALATVTGANTSAFTPTLSTQWRTETVPVTAVSASTNVWFKFVFTSDASGASNNIFVDDINIVNNPVGLNSLSAESFNLYVFPNPASDQVNVSFDLPGKHKVKLDLVDMLGRTIETAVDAELQQGNYEYSFGLGKKPAPGIYFSRLLIDGNAVTQKVVIE